MTGKTNIQWTDDTWNPIVGCSVTSPGCTNCYAMKMAARQIAMGVEHYQGMTQKTNGGAVWTGKIAMAPDHILTRPLHWRKPRKCFVNSMGDLFHEDVPDEWIDRVFAVMSLTPHITYQVLTKRSARMREYIAGIEQIVWDMSPGPIDARFGVHSNFNHANLRDITAGLSRRSNVWLGVSTEDQTRADERIPDLLATPAAVRVVSAEPLLGPVDFRRIKTESSNINAFSGSTQDREQPEYCGYLPGQPALAWVIVGGESGPGARDMNPDWARDIQRQCTDAGVAFFMKQMSRKAAIPADLQLREFPR